MRNQIIRDRFQALSDLSQRVLPSTTAMNKVASLLKRFRLAYEVTETKRKQIVVDNSTPQTWERETLPVPIAEARQRALDAMLAESQPIKEIPAHLLLVIDDLPITLKREDGANNVAGLAHLKFMLGSLLKPTSDEELKFAAVETTEKEEPDERPADPPKDPRAAE